MGAHLSPSAAERWTACPGSHYIAQRLPPLETTTAASEGTLAHSFAAWTLKATLAATYPDAEDIGKPQPEPEAALATDDMLDGAQDYAAAVVAELAAHGGPRIYGIEIDLDGLSKEIGAPENAKAIKGRADFIAICRDGLVMAVDYKFGEQAVIAAENKQLTTYAILARDRYKPDADKAVIGIIQPRALSSDFCAFGATWSTVDGISEAKATLIEAVRKAYWADDTTERKPGDHCKYCPARSVCTAAIAEPLLLALTAAGHAEMVKDATNEQIGVWLTALKRVEKAAGDLSRIAKARIDAGAEIPGWRISCRKTLAWPQRDLPIMQQAEEFAAALGVHPSDLIKETLRTPADLKKTIPAETLKKICEEKSSAALIAR